MRLTDFTSKSGSRLSERRMNSTCSRSVSRLPATVSQGKPPGRKCSRLHTCRRTRARTFAIFARTVSSSAARVRRAVESGDKAFNYRARDKLQAGNARENTRIDESCRLRN